MVHEKNDNLSEKAKSEIDPGRLTDSLPPKLAPLVQKAIEKVKNEGASLQEALGFSPALMKVIYQHGYHLFQSGKFKDAIDTFTLLHHLDRSNLDYIFSIAAANHQAKDYTAAAAFYMVYEIIDPTNPIPYLHLYDCFMKSGYKRLAYNSLLEAERLAALDPKHSELHTKIQLEMNQYKQEEDKESNKAH